MQTNHASIDYHKKDLRHLLTILILFIVIYISLLIFDNKSNIIQDIGSKLMNALIEG